MSSLAHKEPSAKKEPSAGKEPSASKEPSAKKEPSAGKEPSASKEPLTNKKQEPNTGQMSPTLSGLTALLLSLLLPSCGHFWLRCYRWGFSIVGAMVSIVGVFCWSGAVFEPILGRYMLYCLGGIYGVNLLSALILGWQLASKDKLTQQMLAVFPLLFIVFVLLIKFKGILFGAQVYYIPSKSMLPTLDVGDFVLVDVSFGGVQSVRNGDIVVFTRPNESEFYIKRLVAKPGDKLQMYGGQLSVNDELKFSNLNDLNETITTLSRENYFVMGDNYQVSFDSRHWGFLKRSQIVGVYRYTLGNMIIEEPAG